MCACSTSVSVSILDVSSSFSSFCLFFFIHRLISAIALLLLSSVSQFHFTLKSLCCIYAIITAHMHTRYQSPLAGTHSLTHTEARTKSSIYIRLPNIRSSHTNAMHTHRRTRAHQKFDEKYVYPMPMAECIPKQIQCRLVCASLCVSIAKKE